MIGALVALIVGWASILAAIRLPLDRWIHPRGLRRAGGGALAVLALHVLGAPVAPSVALAVLVLGVGVGAVVRWRGRRRVPQ